MDRLLPLFGGVIQLGVLGLIVWAVVQAVGRSGTNNEDEREDGAVSIRRLFVYGLLFATLVLAATGAVLALEEVLTSDRAGDDRSRLALGLALLIVAAPTYGLLLRHARHRLAAAASEARSFSWAAYLNLSLLVSLIIVTVSSQQLLQEVTGVDSFEAKSAAPAVVWGAVWAAHWFWLRAVHGVPGDLHLATGSLTGLVTLVIGAGGLAFAVGDEIYVGVVERVPEGHADPDIRSWIIATILGGAIWGWHWLARYRTAERTPSWHVYVVLIGALGGLVAAVASAATIGYGTLVWFVGDPRDTLSSGHFEFVPVAAAVLVVGAAVWWYHQLVLRRRGEVERNEPLRAYDHLMAAAGMVAAVVGVTLALVAMLELITPEPAGDETQVANRLILASTLVAIGGPIWWTVWSRIRRHVAADPAVELASAVRRIYLTVLFGVGGIVVLVSLITVLFVTIEDLLDGTFGGETVRSFRVGLALIATVTGVAWYHFAVFRTDREHLTVIEPAPPRLRPRHVMLIAPPNGALAAELAFATGADVDGWHRTDDEAMPPLDLEALAALIEKTDAEDTLVVVDADGPHVVPNER
jgi:hypothetical protein